mmetsp:Transcript_45182/g.146828  ORF Transcript_45182/g.146828 Transcript_45182/m.146828 type:complete len:118 (+) Transcript_45182:496-849(+)
MRRSALERRSSLPQHCLCHGRPAALKDAGLRWRTSSPRRLALRSCSFDPPDSQLLGERTHCRCSFDLLVYTTDDVEVPRAWEESDPKHIATSDEVKLRSFTTHIHRVDACVSYKADA